MKKEYLYYFHFFIKKTKTYSIEDKDITRN
jgi:hypothetical protein